MTGGGAATIAAAVELMQPSSNRNKGAKRNLTPVDWKIGPIDEDGFFWQDYLDATQSVEVPQIMFSHVEETLQSGIEIGMALEVPIKSDVEVEKFWVASIVMACGPLLRLRYYGGDDRTLEFWFNLTKEAGHELGWAKENNKTLEPPDVVKEKSPDCVEKIEQFYLKTVSIPQDMLSGDGLSIIDRIKPNMKVEVSDIWHPYKLWVATIKENVGGRLLLEYDTPGSISKSFWMFCTSENLFQYGFSSNAKSNFFLEPPSSIVDQYSYEEWKELTENGSMKDCETSKNLFNNNIDHPKHNFKVGMKLETISPADRKTLCPATVIKVFDDTYFLVQVDVYNGDSGHNEKLHEESPDINSQEKDTWLCTMQHPYIFPVGWLKENGMKINSPKGWTPAQTEDFCWDEYLEATQTTAATKDLFDERESAIDAGLECGMRLEAVDPENENIICAAHVTKIIDNLLWIKLDNYEDTRIDHIVHIRSLDIFPVGWCESNHYPLMPPKDYMKVCSILQNYVPEVTKKMSPAEMIAAEPRSSLWCPKIYFNYRCYTGTMISKGKLATLPKSVGPGPVVLVMREVLSMMVSVGYRSARILKALQCDTKPDAGYNLEVIKAKYRNNTYRANVAVINSGDMVADFCRGICGKIGVCPNLFGPLCIQNSPCPAECHKSTNHRSFVTNGAASSSNNVPKKGKPKGATTSQASKPGPWTGRRKKRRGRWAQKDKEANNAATLDEEKQYLSKDNLEKHTSNGADKAFEQEQEQMSDIEIVGENDRNGKYNYKRDTPSSQVSDDSRSSLKSKDSHLDSPGSSSNSKLPSAKLNNANNTNGSLKRYADWNSCDESEASADDLEYLRINQQKQRRPKTRKLDSNPLFWTVDDVFKYLRKTTDCKELAYKVKQEEIDGLAFLLLNFPSLTQHMKLRTSAAMKLCRHIEQVKVTFFLKHINESES